MKVHLIVRATTAKGQRTKPKVFHFSCNIILQNLLYMPKVKPDLCAAANITMLIVTAQGQVVYCRKYCKCLRLWAFIVEIAILRHRYLRETWGM